MLQQMAGVPLTDNLHLFDEVADKFEKLPIYFMTFHGQQTIRIVMEVSKNLIFCLYWENSPRFRVVDISEEKM